MLDCLHVQILEYLLSAKGLSYPGTWVAHPQIVLLLGPKIWSCLSHLVGASSNDPHLRRQNTKGLFINDIRRFLKICSDILRKAQKLELSDFKKGGRFCQFCGLLTISEL